MTVFISYSFDDQPDFENVADWLDNLSVPYWKPAEIRTGESLREQLHQVIGSCAACIFIATRNSVNSSWCNAELGAFWISRIPIITYLADSYLAHKDFPPIVQGDVWDQKLSHIAARAAELVKEKERSGTGSISRSDKITNITVGQLEKIIAGAVSLVRAAEERGSDVDDQAVGPEDRALDAAGHVLRAADAASNIGREPGDAWRRRILWVDDRPDNNAYERQVFESLGFTFDLARSTDEALELLRHSRYGAIISDMGRPEGPREGYRLLEAVRASDKFTHFFIYASSNKPEHKREAAERGAQGSTNRASELVDLVTQALSSHDVRPL